MTSSPATEFEREKVCYTENSQHARALNAQLNAIPALAVTITGGLWLGAAATQSIVEPVQFALLILAGLGDIVLALAVFRVRNVLETYLEVLQAFHPPSFPAEQPSEVLFASLNRFSMVKMYCGLIVIAAIGSFVGAFGLYWPFASKWMLPGVLALVLIMIASWVFVTQGWKSSARAILVGSVLIAAVVTFFVEPA